MAANAVKISDDDIGFIEAQLSTGRFASASEVVHEGLRLLEQREAQEKRLADALRDGEASGEAIGFDVDAWLEERRADGTRGEAA